MPGTVLRLVVGQASAAGVKGPEEQVVIVEVERVERVGRVLSGIKVIQGSLHKYVSSVFSRENTASMSATQACLEATRSVVEDELPFTYRIVLCETVSKDQ